MIIPAASIRSRRTAASTDSAPTTVCDRSMPTNTTPDPLRCLSSSSGIRFAMPKIALQDNGRALRVLPLGERQRALHNSR